MKSSVLVTGGAGFIGSHVADYLLKKGYEVVILDDLSGGSMENVPEGALFVGGSITDVGLVNSLFKRFTFEKVFHLAAYAAENLSHFIKHFNYENNVIGSINLINAAIKHNVKLFVFSSSAAVYGHMCEDNCVLHEDVFPHPIDSYGIAKWTVEQELMLSKRIFDLPYLIFRFHNVYGERQNLNDKYRNVMGIFLNQMTRGEPLSIFGDGSQVRCFTHVDDVAPWIAMLAEKPAAYNEIFNIGSDETCAIGHLGDLMQKAYGRDSRIDYLPIRHEAKSVICSHEKIKDAFDYWTSVSIQDGIQRMTTWAKDQVVREPKEFAEIEIYKNLPPSWAREKMRV